MFGDVGRVAGELAQGDREGCLLADAVVGEVRVQIDGQGVAVEQRDLEFDVVPSFDDGRFVTGEFEWDAVDRGLRDLEVDGAAGSRRPRSTA